MPVIVISNRHLFCFPSKSPLSVPIMLDDLPDVDDRIYLPVPMVTY